MRIFILLLISMCVFAVEPRLPADKDLPGWAKQLSVKWENAWGKNAPWRQLDKVEQTEAGAQMRIKTEKEYNDLFAKSFDTWSATAKLTKKPDRAEGAWAYNGRMNELARDKAAGHKHDLANWVRNDEFFIAYVTMNNDPLALAFLFVPVNRNHYAATTPQ